MKKFLLILLLLVSSIYGSVIDTHDKAIRLIICSSKDVALKTVAKIKAYDTYIYQTTTTKTPYYIIYAVNIPKSKMESSLKNFKKNFHGAFAISDSRISYLSSKHFNQEFFAKASVELNVKEDNQEVIATKTIKTNKEVKIAKAKVVKKKVIELLINKTTNIDNIIVEKDDNSDFALYLFNPTKEDNIIVNNDKKADDRVKLASVKSNRIIVSDTKNEVSLSDIDKDINSISTKNNQIKLDPNKKAILLGYKNTKKEAVKLANKYSKFDIYVYNTLKAGHIVYAVYAVNIPVSDFKHVFYTIKVKNREAQKVSTVRLRYFAKNVSSNERFVISSNSIQTKPVTQVAKSDFKQQVDISDDSLISDDMDYMADIVDISPKAVVLPEIDSAVDNSELSTNYNNIDINKDAIFVGYAQNQAEIDSFKDKYANYDLFVYDTIKYGEYLHAIYLVNIPEELLKTSLVAIQEYNSLAKIVSKTRLKYFATLDSSDNTKLIASSSDHNPIVSINSKADEVESDSKSSSINKSVSEDIVSLDDSGKIMKNVLSNMNISTKTTEKVVNNVKAIDSKAKVITVLTTKSQKWAKQAIKRLPKNYDYYIYKTKTEKVPRYVVYAINIQKNNLKTTLASIQKVFSDAYVSCDKRASLIASNESSEDIFVSKLDLYKNTVALNN